MQTTKLDPDLQVTINGPHLDEERGADLVERLTVVFEHKHFILYFVGIATVAAVIVALLLPKTYEANSRIMPPQQNPSVAAALLAQLGPLAALAPRDFGMRSSSELYVDMLRSRGVADRLIQRFSLMQVYHSKDIEAARANLLNVSDIN